MEAIGSEEQYMPNNDLDSESFPANENSVSYEQAEKLYDDGRQLRDHIYEMSDHDAIYCNEIFNEVYTKVFTDINAEERAGHVMYRVLVGTTISSKENRTYVADEKDRYIYENFLIPLSRAQSKTEMQNIIDDMYDKNVIMRSVQ